MLDINTVMSGLVLAGIAAVIAIVFRIEHRLTRIEAHIWPEKR